jgi:hypothetical protein
VYDTATLNGGSSPTGKITFHLYGPQDTDCSGNPVFASTAAVNGNGNYRSQSFTPAAAGAYRWVADYSGDAANHAAGPTTCGDSAEFAVVRPPDVTRLVPVTTTAVNAGVGPTACGASGETVDVSGALGPNADPGPIAPAPKPKPKPNNPNRNKPKPIVIPIGRG